MKKILVPIAGFRYSEKVLKAAKEIAEAMAGEVTILNIVDIAREEKYIYDRGLMEEIRAGAIRNCEETLNSAKQLFENFTGKIDTVCKLGNTADEIIDYADKGGYDLIIMGNRGAGVLPGFRLGSVADKVVHYSNVSVLVVK